LRLPFFVTDSDSGLAVTAASRVGEVVTLTVTGHGFDIVSGGAVSATLDPSGANNGIYLEAASGILSGVVSCEIAVSVDSAATTCAVVGNKITVTSGDKNVMVVSGGTMWGNAITWDALIFNPLYDWWEGTAEVTDADFNTYSVPVTLFLDEGQDNAFQLNISEAAWLSSEQNETFPSGLTYVTTGGSSGGTPTVSARANTGSEVFALINATTVCTDEAVRPTMWRVNSGVVVVFGPVTRSVASIPSAGWMITYGIGRIVAGAVGGGARVTYTLPLSAPADSTNVLTAAVSAAVIAAGLSLVRGHECSHPQSLGEHPPHNLWGPCCCPVHRTP